MKNYQSILTVAVGLGVALLTINGTIQQYITFSGVLNEIAFAIMGLMLCMGGLISVDYKKLVKGLL